MREITQQSTTYPFLQGGGEMGELTRNFDWSATALGTPDKWPQSLRTGVGIVISSSFPMLLWWGDELIQFYNDAFRPSLGTDGKHPSSLGQPAAGYWKENWHVIKPLIDKVMLHGESSYFEDLPIPNWRNGRIEEVYWTFSYSPLRDESGAPAAVLMTCFETTVQVTQRRQLEASENRFRTLVEKAVSPVFVLKGEDMVLEMANQPLFDIWEVGREAIGKPFLEILPEMKDQPFIHWMRQVYHSGESLSENEAPARFHRKNGQVDTHYWNFVYQPYYEKDGTRSGVLAQSIEITEQVTQRQKIEESEARFRTLVEEAPVAMFIFRGEDMVINTANKLALEMIGRTEAAIGKPLLEVIPELKGSPAYQVFQEVYHTGETRYGQEVLVPLKKAGILEDRWFNFVYTPFLENGRVMGVMDVATEVTEQVSARQKIEEVVAQRTKELAAANLLLEQNNQELEQFAYIASHDLQEPLRKVSTFSQMLQAHLGQMDERSKNYFDKINSSTLRMMQLIHDVLDFSQLSSQRQVFETVNIGDIIKNLTSDFELLIDQKKAVINVGDLPSLTANPLQMRQLFSNLLSNALKFTKEGVAPVISISVQHLPNENKAAHKDLLPEVDYCLITVEDNGIGFGAEHADKIFSIFQRLHGKSEFEGTGIGLALCKKIAQNHHGEIWATAEKDKGAAFRIILPCS